MSVFFSRQLSMLQRAKDTLTNPNGTCSYITPTNLSICKAAAASDIKGFTAACNYNAEVTQAQKTLVNRVVSVFGKAPHNEVPGNPGFAPMMIMIGFAVFYCWKVYTAKRGVTCTGASCTKTPEYVTNIYLGIYLCVLVPLVTIGVSLLWTVGSYAESQSTSLDTSKLPFGDANFTKIWNACLEIYKDSTASPDPCAALPPASSGSTPAQPPNGSTQTAECLQFITTNSNNTIIDGLNALIGSNIENFDATILLKNISEDVAAIQQTIAPSNVVPEVIPANTAKEIIQTEVTPVLSISLGSCTDDTSMAQLYVDKAPKTTELIAKVITAHWPSLDLAMYMDIIDSDLEQFYTYRFYHNYLRDIVLELLVAARETTAATMLNTPEGYASMAQFSKNNWGDCRRRKEEYRRRAMSLYKNLSIYNRNFALSSSNSSDPLWATLQTLWIRSLMVIAGFVCLGLSLYKVKDVINTDIWKKIDIATMIVIYISFTVIFVSTLKVMVDKSGYTAQHNLDAKNYNTQMLVKSAWSFLIMFGPINCSAHPPTGATQCDSGDQTLTTNALIQEVCAAGGSSQVDACSDTFDMVSYYTNTVNLIKSFKQCNYITGAQAVPFPKVELSLYFLVAICMWAGLYQLFSMSEPFRHLSVLRKALNMRKLILDGGDITDSMKNDMRVITCQASSLNIKRILMCVLALIFFIIAILVALTFSATAVQFNESLKMLYMTCI